VDQTVAAKTNRRTEQAYLERREEILDAATKLFAEHGFSDTVTQVLVETVQIGKGTLYRYFPSKRDLFLATADRVMRQMRTRVDERVEGIDEPLERLAVAVESYLAFFAEHPEYVELLIQERALFKDRQKPTYFEHREDRIERWRTIFRGLIAEGRVRDIPVERITDVLGNVVYGTMFTNHFTGLQQPPQAQARDIMDILFLGVLSETERRGRRVD
jgi:AcrR family transcriptional regulator